MLAIQRFLSLACAATFLVFASGCTKVYYFQLSCVVTSAVDGKPLAGVTAVVDIFGKKEDLSYGDPIKDPFDAKGGLTHTFFVSVGSSALDKPHWYLKLQKEGFHPEVVEIKPLSMPEKAGTITPISRVVHMRPKERLR
jgi:hypothetical protein